MLDPLFGPEPGAWVEKPKTPPTPPPPPPPVQKVVLPQLPKKTRRPLVKPPAMSRGHVWVCAFTGQLAIKKTQERRDPSPVSYPRSRSPGLSTPASREVRHRQQNVQKHDSWSAIRRAGPRECALTARGDVKSLIRRLCGLADSAPSTDSIGLSSRDKQHRQNHVRDLQDQMPAVGVNGARALTCTVGAGTAQARPEYSRVTYPWLHSCRL